MAKSAETKHKNSEPRSKSAPAQDTRPAEEPYHITDPQAFGRNMAKVADRSQRLLSEFLSRQTERLGREPIDPLNIGGAWFDLFKHMAANPAAMLNAQWELWRDYFNLLQHTAERAMGHKVEPVASPAPGDRRFRDPEWQESLIFDFIKQSYLLSSNWVQRTVAGVPGMDEKMQNRALFYAKQFADAIAPSNFILTNPEVLRETLRSNGDNLVRGLDNLLSDLERGQGELSIRQTSGNFVIGKEIAVSPGKVVFRNELFELLQYNPSTEQVYRSPLLVFPPWINKFYILDLKPENSFVRWAVSRGYTVFVVSWVNPGPALAEKNFEDYMRGGIFAALDAVEKATGEQEVNVIGYCIAGTLLAATLAYCARTGEYRDRVKSATFLAAQVDFADAGDLQVFVDDEQLAALERQMRASGGVLEGSKMAQTFNLLRANDLIWSFVVNNYLLGREPMPFDLLYWNSDTTRMPLKLHLSYLRECYRDNNLAEARMRIGDELLDVRKVTTPAFFQAAREDHIAPAASVYRGARLFSGEVRYMLAGSGHIAGVINPPAAGKYQHWTNDALPATLDLWRAGATEHAGSWWPYWDATWLGPRSGELVPARVPGDQSLSVLGNAPGTYVFTQAGALNTQPKTRKRKAA